MSPGEWSRDGNNLFVYHPHGGIRPAAHVFDIVSGGIAFLDHGWTEPLVSFHVAHYLEGTVTSARSGWNLETAEDGRVYISSEYPWASESRELPPDGDRQHAFSVFRREFPAIMVVL